MIALPREIETTGNEYLRRLDSALPGRITGFIVTGSAVMADYRQGRSDLDFLALLESALDPAEIKKLQDLHKKFSRDFSEPDLDGAYVTVEQLAGDPRGISVPRVREGILIPSDGYAANPVAWITAARYPARLRGEAPRIWSDESALRAWCAENGESYWRNWVRKARTVPGGIAYSLSRDAASWGVLGVTRIHATIKTGEILSKGAAVSYAHETFGSAWMDIIDEARRYRDGAPALSLRSPIMRRARLLAYMNFVINDANPILSR